MSNAHVGHASGMPLEAVTTFLQAIFQGKEGQSSPVWFGGLELRILTLSYANALGDTPARFQSRGVGDGGEGATWPGGRAYGTWLSRSAWLSGQD